MMADRNIREKCHVNTNRDIDTFVGIECSEGDIHVHFPLGFHLSEDEKNLRKDIKLLIDAIASTVGKKDSSILKYGSNYQDTGFPIQAYMFLISDYYSYGYYKERETNYQVSNHGKVDWNRTIKTQKPYVNNNSVFYLGLVTRKKPIIENELITQIHEYCVYQSFQRIGWLFSADTISKPKLQFNPMLFRRVVNEKLLNTYNTRHKLLFTNMLAVIEDLRSSNSPVNYRYGTHRFEYVWEAMIDRVYGIKGKSSYFPATRWILGEESHANASLEPDSIMICGNNIYVLDAKYYKYGATRKYWDLPESTSINKQITYGEYIATNKRFKEMHGTNFRVFNAFIMPFDSEIWSLSQKYYLIGEALSDWKDNTREYEHVKGVLLDIKHLMKLNALGIRNERNELAACINGASVRY